MARPCPRDRGRIERGDGRQRRGGGGHAVGWSRTHRKPLAAGPAGKGGGAVANPPIKEGPGIPGRGTTSRVGGGFDSGGIARVVGSRFVSSPSGLGDGEADDTTGGRCPCLFGSP